MLNIMVAVRVWKYCWARKSILIYCDNQAVVSVLNSDKTHDMLWAALAHNISMNIAMADINIKLIHIMSKKNVLAYSFSKHQDPQHQDKVSQIFTIAPQRLHQSLRNSTSRAYNLMFRIFIAFSIFANIQLCHLSSNHILAFREFLVFNKECHMTLNYISAIKYKFSIFHLDISPFLDPRIKYILYFNKSLSLNLSQTIISMETLTKITKQCDYIYMGQVFKAAFLFSCFPSFVPSYFKPGSPFYAQVESTTTIG